MHKLWLASGLACVMIAGSASVAAAEEGTLLRYKWTAHQQVSWSIAINVSGRVTTQGSNGTRTMEPTIQGSMALFGRIDKVTPEGLAYMKVSFGLMSFDTALPNGATQHVELNPANGTLMVSRGQQVQKRELGGAAGVLLDGFTAVLNDRGQITKITGNEQLEKVLAGLPMGGGGKSNLQQMLSWIEPILPEKPVKIGDEWQIKLPLSLVTGKAGAEQITVNFRYEGDEKVGDVMCRKLLAKVKVADLDFTIPPALGNGLTTDVKGLNADMAVTYFLSTQDTHMLRAHMDTTQSCTAHTQGTVQSNGQDVNVDQTTILDGLKMVGEIKRM